VADYGLNVLNSRTAALLAELGAASSTISIEASFADVAAITAGAFADWPLELAPQFELLIHGPMPGMILEHCLIANALGGGKQEFCRAPCQQMTFSLKDEKGQTRRLWTDQHCRNHISSGSALALLGQLPFLLRQGIGVLRIEGQLYEPQHIAEIVSLYRKALDLALQNPQAKHPVAAESWEQLEQASGAELNLGALAQTVTHSVKTAKLMRAERAAAPSKQAVQGEAS
jgi:putative protease